MASRAILIALVATVVAPACYGSSAWRATLAQGGTSVAARQRTPDIQLWVSGNDIYHRGERARVYFRTDDDAYVLVVRIDTDGRVRVLYPESPGADNFARGGVSYRVPGYGRESFYVDDYPGMGYVFAIASWRRLELEAISSGARWDYQLIGDRISRDPFVVVHDIAARVTGNREDDYALDVAEYHVDRRAEYPRFLCYDCHAFRAYSVWNPYAHRCAKFRIVIYDDPFYYPYRHYPGTRVVYVRRQRRWPRYELKERGGRGGRGGAGAPYIERRRRGDGDDGRPSVTEALGRRVTPPTTIAPPRPTTEEGPTVIRPRRERPPDGDIRIREPERSDGEPTGRDRAAPRATPRGDDRPARVEPRRSEPSPSERPRDAPPPRRSEPPKSEPTKSEPTKSEPAKGEPRREPSARTSPQSRRIEPRRVEPR